MDSQKMNFTPLSNMETSAFCSQMSMVLSAGISSLEGAAIMAEDAKSESEKELMNSIYQTLLETGSLYLAIADTNAFPAYMVSLVQIGEQTGRMDEVMESLASYYEKEASLAQTIKNAITYPFIMILMMVIVVLVLLMKVMPVFNQVYSQLGAQMTGFSKIILQIGSFLNGHILIFAILLAIIILLGFYLLKTKSGQNLLLKFSESFQITRMLSDKISAYRFANGMALTLSSGLTPEESLNLSSDLITDGHFKTQLDKCKAMVNEGKDLCDSLLDCHIFTGIYTRMAVIANRTGQIDDVMRKISGQMEEEIDNSINQILSSIEPTLVIILSVIVGIILLSVMLPLVNIMASL